MNQLEHWASVYKQHQLIVDFMDFVNQLGIGVAIADHSDLPEDFTLDDLKSHRLADRFLEVDRKQLNAERMDLLRRQRELLGEKS